MIQAFVALGSNLGGPITQLQQALQALASCPQVGKLRCSSLVRSPPWDGSAQPDYYNAVAELSWQGDEPLDLLQALQQIETAAGRKRHAEHRNAARTLDLDLLWFGGIRRDGPRLQLPHPRMLDRAFVMRPLAELAPTLVMADGRPAAEHARRLADQPLTRCDWPPDTHGT